MKVKLVQPFPLSTLCVLPHTPTDARATATMHSFRQPCWSVAGSVQAALSTSHATTRRAAQTLPFDWTCTSLSRRHRSCACCDDGSKCAVVAASDSKTPPPPPPPPPPPRPRQPRQRPNHSLTLLKRLWKLRFKQQYQQAVSQLVRLAPRLEAGLSR